MALTDAKIFPNPSTGEMTVSFNANTAENLTLEVTNLVGQVVYSQEITAVSGQNNLTLALNELANGHYLVKVGNSVNSIQIKK